MKRNKLNILNGRIDEHMQKLLGEIVEKFDENDDRTEIDVPLAKATNEE